MDNNKMNENVAVADEMLDDISGGAQIFAEIYCPLCHRYVVTCDAVQYNNRFICRDCMDKIKNP